MSPTRTATEAPRYGSLARRFLSLVYDSVVLLGLLMIAAAVALPVGGAGKVAFRDWGFTAYLLLVTFFYFGACWHYAGMTVGMRAWQVKLVNEKGGRLSWGQCLIRFCVAVFSLGLAGGGFAWSLLDEKNRAWHDLAARAVLIRT